MPLRHRVDAVLAAMPTEWVAARCAHEAAALDKLRTAPTDPWLCFLREHGLSPTGEPGTPARGIVERKNDEP